MLENRVHWFNLTRLQEPYLGFANVYASNNVHEHIELWETSFSLGFHLKVIDLPTTVNSTLIDEIFAMEAFCKAP